MDFQLAQKVVFITGSGRGIGRAMAIAFAAEGARIAVNDVNPVDIEHTIALVEQAGGEAISAQCDITDLAAVTATARAVEERLGRIDVLVNNAAIRKSSEMFLDTDPADCDIEIKVTLYGTMNCCRAVLPGMIARGFGKIVNIATDAARTGQERECNYAAAKGAVMSFTKSLAKEVGRHNINVNAVSPGATNAPMRQERIERLRQQLGDRKLAEREEKVKRLYALRRIGEPDDVANMVVYLASDAARHITGQIVSVNGGYAMPG